MFPEKEKTYPGRKLIQALQVGLVVAIGVFGFMSLSRSSSDEPVPTNVPSPTNIPVSTAISIPTVAVATAAPDNSAYRFYMLGKAAHDLDNYEEAIELYTQVIELDPEMTDAWLSRAVAYAQAGTNERLSRNDFWRYLQLAETDRIEREITIGETLELDMTEGLVYALTFDAQSGDRLNIAASSVENGQPGDEGVVDSLVLLFDTQGALVKADDDTLRQDGSLINLNSRIDDYSVTRDGTYTILVSHAGGGSYGKMNVIVSMR